MTKELTLPDSPLEVDVPLEATPERVVTDEESIKSFKSLGLAFVSETAVRDLAAIGINAKGVGVLKIQRGGVLVTQQFGRHAMKMLIAHMEAVDADKSKKNKTADLTRTAHSVGYLMGKMNECGHLAVEIESKTVSSGAPVTDTPNQQQSFQPKAKIQPLPTTIHNHGTTNILVQEKKP